jgi:LytS/YehU family sensor histidine kinase
MTSIHTGSSYLLVELLNNTGLNAGEMIDFRFNWDPTNSVYSWYIMLTLITFAFWGAFEFLYRYEELLHADRVQSELSLIRSQIRPHFFFNTLNNLYSLALDTGNEMLADGIQDLTVMMRYALKQSTQDLVSVADEWNYIHRYVDLQRLRVDEDKVNIEMRSSGDLSTARVAPMILINFVENAFKHGISYEKESFVHIQLNVDDDHINLMVKNSDHPSDSDSGESGIGTEQTKRLLSLQYQRSYELTTSRKEDEYKIDLSLPVK